MLQEKTMRWIAVFIVLEVFIMADDCFSQNPVVLNPLNADEQRVIIHKGTERPFSGKYYRFDDEGTYLCRQCSAPLYRWEDKFDAGCGWPSFDDEIPGAVRRVPDKDGIRTEIICASCGGHLGHVFVGEALTPKNTRHCVNSISMQFEPSKGASPTAATTERAIFASGCFWGTEYVMRRAPGVLSVKVGYTGGHKENPLYKEVCSGKTGHAEAVEVIFDPAKTSFETLTRLFFETHDPTQVDRQGPDVGEQYRSAIFYTSDVQKTIAGKLIEQLRSRGIRVATKLEPAGVFWPAEDYHQEYYQRTGGQPYCHAYRKLFDD